jgi:hypothetical protein
MRIQNLILVSNLTVILYVCISDPDPTIVGLLHSIEQRDPDFPVIITAVNSFHGRTITGITVRVMLASRLAVTNL